MNLDDWVSAHVFHHGDQDALLVGLIAPLTEELQQLGLAYRFFFLRYWDGGPHVRLRVLPSNSGAASEVREHIARYCDEYLRRHPSKQEMSREQYARSSAFLAELEATTPRAYMYPNNSVEFIPYVRESHRFGTGEAIRAVEEHFDVASRVALELLATRPTVAQRDTAALALLILTWLLCDVDSVVQTQAPGADSETRTWASFPEWEEKTVTAFEEHYRQQRSKLLMLAEQMRATAGSLDELPKAGTVTRWAWSVARTRDVLSDEIAGRRFVPLPRPHLAPDIANGALPVLDQCAHLMCNRIGVTVGGESALRYLAGRAVFDLIKEN
jgi:Lantibiotic biosynthesis dehydratase C-term